MIEKILQNKLIFIGIFTVIGFLGTIPIFSKIFGFICLVLPIIIIHKSRNINEEAFIMSSFIVGAEVYIRMTGGFVLYETGKYAVIFYLILGMLYGRFKQELSFQYILYILLLLIGILFTKVPDGESMRKEILFNLSGPLVLGISAIYFYRRPVSKKVLMSGLFFALLPLFSMISYLYFRTPDLDELIFNTEANFETSGGFGPNQVATAIGFGVLIITIFMISKEKLSGYLILDSLILIYFVFRGLLTFSRGGIITGLICIISFAFFFILYKKISFRILLKYIFIVGFFIVSIWLYTSNVTKGMLDNRYTGKSAKGFKTEDVTSGRADIFELQFENFIDNPLGIGVGNGKFKRKFNVHEVTAASHNEIGRLLEEHGYIGFFLLLLLLIVPLFNFFRGNYYQKALIISFYLMWFLTINHSAMRVALPGFIYALSLIIITDIDE